MAPSRSGHSPAEKLTANGVCFLRRPRRHSHSVKCCVFCILYSADAPKSRSLLFHAHHAAPSMYPHRDSQDRAQVTGLYGYGYGHGKAAPVIPSLLLRAVPMRLLPPHHNHTRPRSMVDVALNFSTLSNLHLFSICIPGRPTGLSLVNSPSTI